MKKTFMLAILLCLSWRIPCFAQSVSISNGTTWFLANQNNDGSWGSQIDLAFVDSAEVTNALKSAGTGSAYANGITFLTSQSADSNDELSRKIISLAKAGIDFNAFLNTLLGYRNSDGGWDYKQGPVSNSFDTALALQALKAANYSDTTVLYQAINFLTTNQNTDVGWGFTSKDPSNAYVTAMVLRSLSGYSSQFSVQSSISNAAAVLLAKQTQNNDGGFGSSPSTVYETALSVMALIESGQGTAQSLLNGINYLTNAQLPNGSWNNDPYSTALALQALAKVRPNLQLSSISLSKPMPREGEDVTINALVANNGLEAASNVIVRFYLGDPATGGVQIGTDQVIPLIALGLSAQASITQSFTGFGAKTVYAVVDPDNLIAETNENDNKASARVWVATGPDLAVFPEDLKPSTYVPATGTAFTFEYKVRNLGETEAGQFSVALYDGDPVSGGTQLQTAALSGVPGNGSRTGTFGVMLSSNGPHTLYLVADSLAEITELSETNNKASATVTVGGVQTGADLAVTPMDITFTPNRPAKRSRSAAGCGTWELTRHSGSWSRSTTALRNPAAA